MHSNMSWCHLGGIVDTGKHYMVKHFLELEPSHSGRHVYIANGVMRSPGCNWIEVDNTVHAFLMEKDLWWEMFEKKSLWFQEWEMFLKWLLVVNTKKILNYNASRESIFVNAAKTIHIAYRNCVLLILMQKLNHAENTFPCYWTSI